jgi:hypothetical protein
LSNCDGKKRKEGGKQKKRKKKKSIGIPTNSFVTT